MRPGVRSVISRSDRDTSRLLRVEHAVARILAEELDEATAYARVLEAVGSSLNYRFAAVWHPLEPGGPLRCVCTWHEDGRELAEFAQLSRGLELLPGVGLPGRLWANNRPAWIPDVATDSSLPRMEAGAAAGLVTALGFPVASTSGEVLAVLEFIAGEPRPPDRRIVATAVSLGRLMGVWMGHRRVDAAIQESEARKAAILRAALDCIITIDHAGCVVELNAAAEEVFGVSAAEAMGTEMAELIVPDELRAAHRAGLRRLLATGEPKLLGRRIETTAQDAAGRRFPVELAITQIDVDGPPMFTGYVRDITERKRAVEELRASRMRIVQAGDTARKRLERDLHDGAQQRLVAVALDLRLARQRLEADPHAAGQLLEGIAHELEQATGELRELARGLHPVILAERGLAAAVAELAARTPLPVTVTSLDAPRFPADVEAAAYFLVSETLTNVIRHAQASAVTVSITQPDGRLCVEISDDGRGGADLAAGSGLAGLADRLAALDGRLEVDSHSGQGTTVRGVL